MPATGIGNYLQHRVAFVRKQARSRRQVKIPLRPDCIRCAVALLHRGGAIEKSVYGLVALEVYDAQTKPLIEFFSADENSMSLLIEEGAGNPDLMRRLPPPQWYSPEDGLGTVKALIAALGDDPQQLGTEGPQVLSELLEYECVLEKAMRAGHRWHLAVSWR